jgi:hypothetical protein
MSLQQLPDHRCLAPKIAAIHVNRRTIITINSLFASS